MMIFRGQEREREGRAVIQKGEEMKEGNKKTSESRDDRRGETKTIVEDYARIRRRK